VAQTLESQTSAVEFGQAFAETEFLNSTMTLQHSKPLEGIIPPMITPLAGRDRLDEPGLERLLEHIIGGGVQGLFILGTCGEAPSLSYRLRRELITRVCQQVRGRLPVLVGITDTSKVEAVGLARHADEAGANALVTSAPYYFPIGQPELVNFVERLVGELPLPLYLYNMPQLTKVQFSLDTVKRFIDQERIVGVKDSSGDLNYFQQLLKVVRTRPDWRLFMGQEYLLVDGLRSGAHGGVVGGANIAPALLVEIYHALKSGNETKFTALNERLRCLGKIYPVGQSASALIKGLKCALKMLGVCHDELADPLMRYTPQEQALVRGILVELELLPV
jgi:2-dehydro-3-deoxy-D-pentonate aldolase